MKRKISIHFIFFFIVFIILNDKIYGISEEFKFVVDTIGIPQYNAYGEEINEQIYYTYNIFSYSTPQSMYSRTSTQRFKEVPNNGKWTKDGGAYNGSGIRGEYYVLGTNYSGGIIDNVYFPVDAVPETTPDNWNYVYSKDAYNSWQDGSKYKYIEQLDFMKNSKLLFDTIDYATGTCNSYNLIEYNITPISIGLEKVRLNTCSTWKTMGVVTTKRRNNKGKIRTAIFATKPMAASANIKSKINCLDEIKINSEDEYIYFKINFGSDAINLNNYANKKHIKEIVSSLRINGEEVSIVSDSKKENISKEVVFKIDRKKYKNLERLKVEVNSYLYTEFSVDGLMQDKIEKNITIKIDPKIEVPVKEAKISQLQKDDINYYVVPLMQTSISKKENSEGILEGGTNLACKLKLNVNRNDIKDLKIYVDNKKSEFKNIGETKDIIKLEINLPLSIYSTIAGWDSLRKKEKNYFKIVFDDIGKRIKSPHTIEFIFNYLDKEYKYNLKFDTIDNLNANLNFEFKKLVLNKLDIEKKVKLNEW
ncbi:MAG: hypothetical protein RSA08_04380 [Clostridia bacterium]